MSTTRSGILLPEIPERINENPEVSSLNDEEDQPEVQPELAVNDADGDTSSCGQCGDGSKRPNNLRRLVNRLRRWHVTFGNPALGTYAGIIVTLHPRSRRRQRTLLGDDDGSSSGSNRYSDDDEYDDDSDSSDSSDDSFFFLLFLWVVIARWCGGRTGQTKISTDSCHDYRTTSSSTRWSVKFGAWPSPLN